MMFKIKKSMIRKILLMQFLLLTGMSLRSQDVHFSQFYSTPLIVNPAMTGIVDGKFRISNNYRSQWGSAGGYSTFHISGDMPLGRTRFKNNYFGVGLLIYQDKAGDAKFTNTVMEGSLAYTTTLDDGDNYIAIGFRGGIDSREMDLSKATWDNQWNGDVYNPLLSGESLPYHQRSYFDFTAGLMWYYIPDGRNNISVGGSMSHIAKPDLSFSPAAEDVLNNTIIVHASAELCMDPYATFWVAPKLFAQFEGVQREIVAGSFVKTRVQIKTKYTNFKKDMYFSFGAWYRLEDAFILATRFEFNDFGLGISYDFTTSELGSLLGSGGGPEFTLSYVMSEKRGQRTKHFNKMPKFF